jgi:hypothetical protein
VISLALRRVGPLSDAAFEVLNMSKSSNNLVIVTFAKSWRGYSPTEVAGFSQETADALIKGGVAALHDGKAAASPAKSTATKPPGKGAPKAPTKAEVPPVVIPGSVETEPGSETDGGTGGTSDENGPPAGDADNDVDDEKP